MPESRPPIDLHGVSLAELQALIDQRKLPPVERWNPSNCGDSGMRIARDGTWYHHGRPIGRASMVRLFSTILRRESDGGHVLVTPVEKLAIAVDSTAFRAIEMRTDGTRRDRNIWFGLDSGDVVLAGRDHPLIMARTPRVALRHGLEAELSRPVYYELAQIALDEGGDPPGVWSDARFFALADCK